MTSPTPVISLREITADTVRTICDLQVLPAQGAFVASNAVSIAQAYFEPKAWFRAIHADETPWASSCSASIPPSRSTASGVS